MDMCCSAVGPHALGFVDGFTAHCYIYTTPPHLLVPLPCCPLFTVAHHLAPPLDYQPAPHCMPVLTFCAPTPPTLPLPHALTPCDLCCTSFTPFTYLVPSLLLGFALFCYPPILPAHPFPTGLTMVVVVWSGHLYLVDTFFVVTPGTYYFFVVCVALFPTVGYSSCIFLASHLCGLLFLPIRASPPGAVRCYALTVSAVRRRDRSRAR